MAELLDQVIDQPAAVAAPPQPQLHIRFEGRSIDLPMQDIDIGPLSTDDQIRNATALHLGVPPVKLQAFAIDRNQATGDTVLRPEAVFG